RKGNTEADARANRFFALFERSENSITIFRFDLAARDQQIHQLNDGVPALGRLHFRDDLISGKKLSQRHADSSGAGSLSCRFRMTRSIWLGSVGRQSAEPGRRRWPSAVLGPVPRRDFLPRPAGPVIPSASEGPRQ